VLLYNHAGTTAAQPATVTVTLRGLRPGPGRASLVRIDADHANPRRAWEQLGSPEYPTRRQLAEIADASELRTERLPLAVDRQAGTASFTIALPAEGVAAIHLGL
jgi:xylan 1,4-beta-xylosidase